MLKLNMSFYIKLPKKPKIEVDIMNQEVANIKKRFSKRKNFVS